MRHLTIGLVLVLAIIFTANAFAEKEWKSFKDLNNNLGMAVQGDYLWWITSDEVVRFNTLDNSFDNFKMDFGAMWPFIPIAATPDGVLWAG